MVGIKNKTGFLWFELNFQMYYFIQNLYIYKFIQYLHNMFFNGLTQNNIL